LLFYSGFSTFNDKRAHVIYENPQNLFTPGSIITTDDINGVNGFNVLIDY
jgi:hypothetical protein